jgi:hypothetical protein
MCSKQIISYRFHSMVPVYPAFHPQFITALFPVVRRAHIPVHTNLLMKLRTPFMTTYYCLHHTKCRKGRVLFFFVAFFCNLWVSGWKLRSYRIRVRRWSVKAVCGDAMRINHVCICSTADRHSFLIHLLEPPRRQLALALREYCHYAQKPRLIGDVYAGILITIILLRCGCLYFALSFIFRFFLLSLSCFGARGGAVVEALRYKPEGRWIDSRWYHWNFSLT